MPTPTKGPRLGGGPAHERLMLANLATALFEHGRITTTEAKAKRLRPLAERLITFAKRGDLHARRRVLTVVRDKGVVHALFTEIGPRFENRPGGYTRITKVGPRKGDNAPMAVIELVEALTVAQQAVGEAERARGTRFARGRRTTGTPASAAPGSAAAATGEAEDAAEAAEVAADDAERAEDARDIGDPDAAVDAALDAQAQAAAAEELAQESGEPADAEAAAQAREAAAAADRAASEALEEAPEPPDTSAGSASDTGAASEPGPSDTGTDPGTATDRP